MELFVKSHLFPHQRASNRGPYVKIVVSTRHSSGNAINCLSVQASVVQLCPFFTLIKQQL